jgi:integrase
MDRREAFRLAGVLAGLRRGEACGLRDFDVDLEISQLTVLLSGGPGQHYNVRRKRTPPSRAVCSYRAGNKRGPFWESAMAVEFVQPASSARIVEECGRWLHATVGLTAVVAADPMAGW